MNRRIITVFSLACVSLAVSLPILISSNRALAAAAPDAKGGGKVEVKIDQPKIEVQKAPKFNLDSGTTLKKFTQKDWLEIEFKLEFDEPKGSKDVKFLDDVKVEYYMYLDSSDKDKRKTLTATVDYVNVPVKEEIHAVVYISPATIYNLTGDRSAKPSSIRYWGIEIKYGGETIGELSNLGEKEKAWWRLDSAPPADQGRLLQKFKTPFAPLWYDYHMEEKIQ